MNCWEILGIAQTSDLTAIKKAYAAKAKEWHPEEHPEEFRRLQQAYQSAVRMAKIRRTDFGQTKAHKEVRTVQTAAESGYETAIQKTEVSPVNIEGLTGKNIADNESPSLNYEDIEKQSRNPDCGDTSKQSGNCDYEEITEQSQTYDYEEVEAVDLKDCFFQEFFSIAWNPYLMNNLVCWEYILKRSPYEKLLSDPAFRRNFVLTVCHQLMGWQRGTILFFEKWLLSHPAEDASGTHKKETDLLCWKFRKIGLFGKLVPTQRCVANEQKQLHGIFLSQVEHCGLDPRLKSAEDVECYLSFYLPYAAEQQSKIKRLYHESCQGRTMLMTLLMMVPVFIGMVIYVQVSVVPQLEKRKAEEAEQQRIQQKTEEIRQYNELLQNGDYTEPE